MNNLTRRSFLKSHSSVVVAAFFSFSPVSLFAAIPSASSLLTKKPCLFQDEPSMQLGLRFKAKLKNHFMK